MERFRELLEDAHEILELKIPEKKENNPSDLKNLIKTKLE
jgi:hypothetical protein